MDFVFCGFFLFVLIIGFIHIVSIFEKWVLKSKIPANIIIIIPISGHMEEMEMLAREYKAKYKHNEKVSLLFLDMGMDKETRDICEIFCADNRNFILCYYHQIDNILRKNVVVK